MRERLTKRERERERERERKRERGRKAIVKGLRVHLSKKNGKEGFCSTHVKKGTQGPVP